MTLAMKYADKLEEGKQIGIELGIAEGRAKGIAEGRAKGIAEGRAKGIAEGRTEGKIAELISLVKEDLIPLSAAVERSGLSEKEFVRLMNQ